jgi:hypothetical protein
MRCKNMNAIPAAPRIREHQAELAPPPARIAGFLQQLALGVGERQTAIDRARRKLH